MTLFNETMFADEHGVRNFLRGQHELTAEKVEELERIVDGQYTLIHDENFRAYAKIYVEQCHEINLTDWPFMHIDFEQVEADLKKECWEMVEIQGETYYYGYLL